MKENLKSLILLALVGTSLLLTYQLWYGQQPVELTADEDIYERIIIEQPRHPEQIVFPETIVTNAENGFHIFREGEQLYYRLWEKILGLMNRAFEEEIPGAADLPEGAPLLLSCYMNPFLPVGSDQSLLPILPEGELARLDLVSWNESYWIRLFTADEELLAAAELTASQTAALKELIVLAGEEERATYKLLDSNTATAAAGEGLIVAGAFFLPQQDITLARYPVKAETINKEQLLKTFFVDYSLARTIEEKDGAVIYTDGERGLRLTAAGFEYSYPRLEEGEANQTVAEALNSSGTLISFHGGWPAGLRLEKITHSRLGRSVSYSAQWRMYYRGYPLYAAKPTRIVFNDRGLIHFSRLIYNIQAVDQDQAELRVSAGWQEALKIAVELFRKDAEEQSAELKLEAFNLGYAVVAGVNELWAEPIWHIQINDRRILLRIDNLLQFKAEDLR